MKFTKRRVVIGAVSAAVVVTMTSVSTWALADDKTKSTAAAAKPVRLIVGYKAGSSPAAADAKMSALGARRTAAGVAQQALTELGATTVEVPAARSSAAITSLRSDPNVAWVEVDRVAKAFDLTPDDPEFANQPELQDVAVPTAWDTTTGAAVKIAVLDTGVNPVGDLAGAVTAGYDFENNDGSAADDEGHGTAVAALIAARGNNSAGMAGVCWSCQIIPVKVLDEEGYGYLSNIAKGIVWAVKRGAKVINLSLGGPQTSKVLTDAVAYANANSVLVVAAAGNDTGTARQFPAALGFVVAVGATVPGTNRLEPWSARNASGDQWVDVAAPGTVTTMTRTGEYVSGIQGTSFSAPIVSGIAGLIKSQNPSYSGWSLMNALQRSASATRVAGTVHGRVNASTALTVPTDRVAPTSSGISPGQNALVRSTITVRPLNVKDNHSGIRNVILRVNGVYKGDSTKAPFAIKFNTAGRNGPVKLQMRIYDRAGNVRTLDRTVVADNIAPTVRITKAPKNGAKISGKVRISYTGSDRNGMKLYQLIINGKVAQTHTGTAPFVFAAKAVPKKATVQVRGYDRANNVKYSAKYTYRR